MASPSDGGLGGQDSPRQEDWDRWWRTVVEREPAAAAAPCPSLLCVGSRQPNEGESSAGRARRLSERGDREELRRARARAVGPAAGGASQPASQQAASPAAARPPRTRSPAQQPYLHLSLSPLNMPFAHPLGAPSKAAPSQPAVVDASALPPSPPAGRPQPGTAAAAVPSDEVRHGRAVTPTVLSHLTCRARLPTCSRRSIRPLSEAMSLPSTRSSRPARRRSTTETSRMSRPCIGPGPSEPPRPEQDHLWRAHLLTRRDLLARSSYSASTLR